MVQPCRYDDRSIPNFRSRHEDMKAEWGEKWGDEDWGGDGEWDEWDEDGDWGWDDGWGADVGYGIGYGW